MRILACSLLLALGTLSACKGDPAPSTPVAFAAEAVADPKALYSIEASADPAVSGSASILHLAIRPIEGAVVKEETPFRAKLAASGEVALRQAEFGYADKVRVEGDGPIFEILFDAKEAGEGTIDADMTFFVCMAEACLRTTEKLSVPVVVN